MGQSLVNQSINRSVSHSTKPYRGGIFRRVIRHENVGQLFHLVGRKRKRVVADWIELDRELITVGALQGRPDLPVKQIENHGIISIPKSFPLFICQYLRRKETKQFYAMSSMVRAIYPNINVWKTFADPLHCSLLRGKIQVLINTRQNPSTHQNPLRPIKTHQNPSKPKYPSKPIKTRNTFLQSSILQKKQKMKKNSILTTVKNTAALAVFEFPKMENLLVSAKFPWDSKTMLNYWCWKSFCWKFCPELKCQNERSHQWSRVKPSRR